MTAALHLHRLAALLLCGVLLAAGGCGCGTEVRQMTNRIDQVTDTFVKQGVPVIVGEYGTIASDTQSRITFCKTLSALCHQRGIAAFFWDNGEEYDRVRYQWRTEGLPEALRESIS